MFFFLKSTFGVLFESGSTSPLLLFRSPLVIVGSEFCIRTPFVLIGSGCSGTKYDPPFLPDSPNSPALQGGPLVFSFALASKLLLAILTNLPFLPDSPNSPALQGGPLVSSFALASKLLSAILTNLPFLPDSPNSPKSPALQGGPLVF